MVYALLNEAAPEFTAPSAASGSFTFKPDGQPTVLYFFPKAGTPVCTAEACNMRDTSATDDFKGVNARVVGVSADSPEALKAFASKNKLDFTLVSDSDRKIRALYKIPGSMMGLMDGRVTLIINDKGTIVASEDSTIRAGAHKKLVNDWLPKLKQ
ncbi:uncharacterized protein L969DRAFT_26648 [Mixia osmundae IAM 14324]|uniref:thioredoxin-dependent peroxiredoxin n=1 Tax=Mixia osmundae (strain CBS 9802 / IAM 14324 / JCM 22182 / KY 12970) TaxID=764103 RepID=G7EB43_MIXOS|nr:uncharacterized protein L969DRAFT_26648 [Mixia osmundae IAM 14324]KEI36578.1 hypothetical protein L969DRAFT_26648 [Mixia osmundae IAM 14324]GAB00054.1 hypothetical protein E5Q_06756 [Mixia osmundae IAM 14324]